MRTYKDESHFQAFPGDDEYHILFKNPALIIKLFSKNEKVNTCNISINIKQWRIHNDDSKKDTKMAQLRQFPNGLKL